MAFRYGSEAAELTEDLHEVGVPNVGGIGLADLVDRLDVLYLGEALVAEVADAGVDGHRVSTEDDQDVTSRGGDLEVKG